MKTIFSFCNEEIEHLFNFPAQKPDPIFAGLFPGTLGMLIAAGGTGKSFFALQAAIQVAGGPDLLGLWSESKSPPQPGKTTIYTAEDPAWAIHDRVFHIGLNFDALTAKTVAGHLQINGVANLDLHNPAHVSRIIRDNNDVKLIVFDTLRLCHRKSEVDDVAMMELVENLKKIARETGAAVLGLHHVSKYSAYNNAADMQQASRGSGVLIDNARWQGYLQANDDTHLTFGTNKPNYLPRGEKIVLERRTGGVLIHVDTQQLTDNNLHVINNNSKKKWNF